MFTSSSPFFFSPQTQSKPRSEHRFAVAAYVNKRQLVSGLCGGGENEIRYEKKSTVFSVDTHTGIRYSVPCLSIM